MNIRKIIREEMDNSLGWINDIKPALNQEQNWVLVNDVNPNDIKEGIKIQKYLFNLGYKWFSSEIIMDTIYSIHHFPNKGLRGDLTYYNNKENERDLADKEIERNNNVYYWSQIKPNEINESNDLQWIMDIKSYPTLQQLFDRGEIKEGNVLVLRGEVENGENGEMIWVNDFTVTINSERETLNRTNFTLGPNEIEAEEAMGLSDSINVTFLDSDGNLEVIRKNNKSTQLTESEELQWIKDIEAGDLWTPYVGMKFIVTDGSDDVIYHILDINDEEGWMELKWENNKTGEGEYFGYYMEDYYRMVGEDRIQIVHDNLNESEEDNELQWIMDIKTNNDIAQEIYDGLEWYKEPNVSTDFVKNQWSDINFSVRPGFTEKPIISPSSFYRGFTKWAEEKWGIEKERTLDVYWKLIDLIHNKIKKPITESDDPLQWIKDVNPIPELKVGSCFTDVMDPTQRKWVIIDFKMTPAGTRLVVVKNNDKIFVDDLSPFNSEDIKYMNLEYFEQDLFSGRYKPCQR